MTKEEIDILWQKAMQESIKDGEMFTRYHFAELVEDKVLEEHAMSEVQRLGQEIEQEPVAWIERDIQCDDFDPDSVTCEKPTIATDGWEWVGLYTTPPQRTWEVDRNE